MARIYALLRCREILAELIRNLLGKLSKMLMFFVFLFFFSKIGCRG